MLRTSLLFLAFALTAFNLESQILDPVQWSYSYADKGSGEYEIVIHCEMEGKWHVYAQDLGAGALGGPIPTSFVFEASDAYTLKGGVKESGAIEEYDPNFEMDLKYFEHSTDFRQRIKSASTIPFVVVGVVEYMTCDDSQCIFPDPVDFEVRIVPKKTTKLSTGDISPAAGQGVAATGSGLANDYAVVDLPAPDMPGMLEPVDWSWTAERVDEDEFYLVFTADIDEGWHVYSAYLDTAKIGPVPTAIAVAKTGGVEPLGILHEGTPVTKFDPNFGFDLKFFDGKASFIQRIKANSDKANKASGVLSFMTCNDEMCLPPDDIDFEIDLASAKQTTRSLSLGLTSSASHGDKVDKVSEADAGHSIRNDSEGGKSSDEKSYWGIFFIAFISGFAALLTPCVFPMIPLTVSFFTKQSKTKAKGVTNAIMYGIFIILIYVALGVFVTAIFGAGALNDLAANVWFNLAFFFLLVIFAASFLGAFEITLPSSWVNKADSASNRGGVAGIFFMALVLAIVSFSCTGPIVGTLLVEAASGGSKIGPIVGMFGFSLAIALPFALFAAFPGWLNSLPQSGGWLNSVKVVLGFLELALAFKFLSNADMVVKAHLLERELFLAIWIVIFGMLTMYLLGLIKTSHDSPLPHISVTRLFLAIVTGVFTIYMIPGMWGAPLRLINAFPPPLHYSESPMGVGYHGGGGVVQEIPDGTELGPQGIYAFHDYDEGMAYAKEKNIPVMLDFTGHACVNCRKMEQEVWSDPTIKSTLTNEVVLISLYVDEDIDLPKSEQFDTELYGKKKKIRTVGDKWKLMQEKEFKTNSQPLYVLKDTEGNVLIETANYQDHGTVPVFKEWLDRGMSKFKK